MSIQNIDKLARKCIDNHPVIILGSGASVAHGITGMEGLAEILHNCISSKTKLNKPEINSWKKIRKSLASGKTLESALRTQVPKSLTQIIAKLTWEIIAEKDLALLQKVINCDVDFSLSLLVKKLFNSSNNRIDIVTTNYDRVAEYAVGNTDFICLTGFKPGIVCQPDDERPIIISDRKKQPRIVRVWKVHGSLDWFKNDSDERVISLPLTMDLPLGFQPLIVTPGIEKYEQTQLSPYDSIIEGAKAALGKAKSVLCVGYGFQDNHIQSRLADRCQQEEIPIVVLTKKLTDSAKKFIRKHGGKSYLAIEEDCSGSRIYTQESPSGDYLVDSDYWDLPVFNKTFL